MFVTISLLDFLATISDLYFYQTKVLPGKSNLMLEHLPLLRIHNETSKNTFFLWKVEMGRRKRGHKDHENGPLFLN